MIDSKTKLEDTLKTVGIGLWELSFKDMKLSFDNVFRKLMQLPYESPVNFEEHIKYLDFISEEKGFTDFFRRAMTNDTCEDTLSCCAFKLADGSVRYLSVRCKVTYDDDGNKTTADGLILDITHDMKYKSEYNILYERHQLALNTANIGVWDVTGPEQSFHFDKKYAELLAIDKPSPITFDEFLYYFKRVSPETTDEHIKALTNISLTADLVPPQFRCVLPSGKELYLSNKCTTIYSEDGTPIRTLGATMDVNEYVQMEMSVESKFKQQKFLSEISQNFISSASFDEIVSRSMVALCDFTGSDIGYIFKYEKEAAKFVNTFKWAKNEMFVDDIILDSMTEEEVWSAYLPNNQVYSKSVSFKNNNLEFNVSFINIPIYLEDKLWGYLGIGDLNSNINWISGQEFLLLIFSDLISSALRRYYAEKEKERTISQLKCITDNINGLVCYMGPDRKITMFGGVSKTGIDFSKSIGKRGREVFSHIPYLADYVDKAFESGPQKFDIKVKDLYFMCSLVPVYERKDVLNGVLVTAIDVTEQYSIKSQLEEAMIEAQKASEAKSAFLANMSHEIRTPMNAIIGMTDLLKFTDLTELQRDYVNEILTSSNSLLKIINDILDISKIDANKMNIVPMNFDFSSLVNDVINIINVKASEKDISFVTFISKDLPANIVTDEIRVKQILINILNNSIKFTNHGFVRFIVQSEILDNGKYSIIFTIQDSGIGIKEEDIDKLFMEFEQLDTRRNRKIVGTGLGLPISKKLIELMGGHIEVKSTYGEGSEFKFNIIADVQDFEPIALIKDPFSKFILCYEPDIYHSEIFKYMCIEIGVRCDICDNEYDFADKYRHNNYSHILMCTKINHQLIKDLGITELQNAYVLNNLRSSFSNLGKVKSVVKPLQTITLARIVNDEPINFYNSDQSQDMEKFGGISAPTAKVLVVDDNNVNLVVAVSILKLYDIEAETCMSGLEAISAIKSKSYDLIFMDHMMPDMDGVDTTKIIRQLGKKYSAENLPIVALTANAINGIKDLFIEAGMNDFMPKPIMIEQLTQIINEYIPKEKILKKININEAQEIYMPKSELIQQISQIHQINVSSALNLLADDEEIYKQVIFAFYLSMDERLDKLPKFKQMMSLSSFTVEVHALKSALLNIGADNLGANAKKLEIAGKENDYIYINKYFDSFYDDLISLYKQLSEIFDKKDNNEPKKLKEHLEQLMDYINIFDLELANELIEEMKATNYGHDFEENLEQIYEAFTQDDFVNVQVVCEEIFTLL